MLLEKWAALVAVAVAVVMEATAAFPSSLLIKNQRDTVTLNCSGSPGEQVEWKRDDESLHTSEEFVINFLEMPFTGNYTCWAGSRLLQSFHLVMRVENSYLFNIEGTMEEPDITCWAPSYSGTLNCSWRSENSATFLARLIHSGTKTELCSTEVTLPGNSLVQIQLNNCSFCSYAEETPIMPLVLVLKGLWEKNGYSEVNKTFRLWDVVKPDPPAYLNITGRNVSWAPPATWDLPATYFPLQYGLQLESASSGTENFLLLEEKGLKAKHDCYKAQIRCRDPFINSSWSSWTEWKK